MQTCSRTEIREENEKFLKNAYESSQEPASDWENDSDDDGEGYAPNAPNTEISEQRPVERLVEHPVGPEKGKKFRRLPKKCDKGDKCIHLMKGKCKFQHTPEEHFMAKQKMELFNAAENKGLFNTGERRSQSPNLANRGFPEQNLYNQPNNRENRQSVDKRFATGRTFEQPSEQNFNQRASVDQRFATGRTFEQPSEQNFNQRASVDV